MARALGTLPKIDEAFAAGRLSYAKVRAVTRVANATNEEHVLEVALVATGAQLERICRGYRRATEIESEAAADRRVRARVLGDGLVKLEIVLSADEADLLVKAIEHARAQLSRPVTPEHGHAAAEPAPISAPRASAADALVHMASVSLAGGGPAAGVAAPERYQVVVHVDRDLMSSEPSSETSSERTLAATLEDGTHVSAEALRRIACDGGVVAAAVDDEGAVLNVGRRTRAIPTAIRRALWIRAQGCRFPGCANDRFLHGHHVQHWLHGGPTSLDNLLLVCSFHHRQIHEVGFSLRLTAEGEVDVRTPAGARLSAQPPLAADPGPVDWRNNWWEGSSAQVDAWTATPSWNGEPIDYEAVVDAMITT